MKVDLILQHTGVADAACRASGCNVTPADDAGQILLHGVQITLIECTHFIVGSLARLGQLLLVLLVHSHELGVLGLLNRLDVFIHIKEPGTEC